VTAQLLEAHSITRAKGSAHRITATREAERKQLARLNSAAQSRGGIVRTAEGSWRIEHTRVSLDSIVYAYKDGRPPELIVAEFPSLSLEQVRGAIGFYLSKQSEIEQYLEEQEARWKQFQEASQARQDPLLQRVRARATSEN
jgi:uncharacterized protein (DUF433 family)